MGTMPILRCNFTMLLTSVLALAPLASAAAPTLLFVTEGGANDVLIAAGKEDRVKFRDYTGKPTYYDQIWTSIQTVFMGFIIATIVAVPLGVFCGISPSINAALNVYSCYCPSCC